MTSPLHARGSCSVPRGPARRVLAGHFVVEDGERFAGTHVIADFWNSNFLEDANVLERAMRKAIDAAGATLLHLHLHPFGEGQGYSGVAVLAESHLSVHTWPEWGYAAFDVFLCGDTDAEAAIDVLTHHLRPGRVEVQTLRRGILRNPTSTASP